MSWTLLGSRAAQQPSPPAAEEAHADPLPTYEKETEKPAKPQRSRRNSPLDPIFRAAQFCRRFQKPKTFLDDYGKAE